MLGLYRVAGDSMRPTYAPGNVLLGLRWFRPRVGSVVVAGVGSRLVVKRIAGIDGQLIRLAGDNPAASTDSRHFGPVRRRDLVAKIIVKLG